MNTRRRQLAELFSDLERAGWPSQEIARVRHHFEQLKRHGVRNVDRLVMKMRRAVQQDDRSAYGGVLAEAHYAMRFGRAGFGVEVEPTGNRGPDLLVTATPLDLYVEVKRLRLASGGVDDVSDWYENEAFPSLEPAGSGRPTLKLLGCLRDAHAQLVDGALNAVIVEDFSAEVTRSALLEAMSSIEQESASGLHRKLAAVFYHSGYVATGVLGPNWLWVKPGLPERNDVVRLFQSIVEEPLLDAGGAAWA